MFNEKELEALVELAEKFRADGGKWLLRVKGRKLHIYPVRLGGDQIVRIDVYEAKRPE